MNYNYNNNMHADVSCDIMQNWNVKRAYHSYYIIHAKLL
jgi:hypothetical protein